MRRFLFSKRSMGFLSVLFLCMAPALALANGTDTLGPPSISIAEGSGIVSAGVGLSVSIKRLNGISYGYATLLSGTIDINVPGTVVQVLLYWEGQMSTDVPGDNTIEVNGTEITGDLIGGQLRFFDRAYSSAYRADITSLGLVQSGPNSLSVGGLNFSKVTNGAGVLVIFDDGTPTNPIQLRDGLDLAFVEQIGDINPGTVPQTFSFAASSVDRMARLEMFFSSVSGRISGANADRPTSIEVTVAGTTTKFSNLLASLDGEEWDTVSLEINIPAGATSLTVQAFARDDKESRNLPASFAWTAAGLSVPPEAPECSIGDYVWEDTNRNGCQDVDELGINGVIVELYEDCNFSGNPIDTTTTATNPDNQLAGFYEFNDLVCGQQYGIRFVDNPDDIYVQTDPNSCFDDQNNPNENNDATDSDCEDDGRVCATAGTESFPGSGEFSGINPTIDCGYVCEGKIGDFVWLDENVDGCQDPGENGIEGVAVTLVADCRDQVFVAETTTNDIGYYEFTGLCPGQYEVQFGDGRPNTLPDQSCDADQGESDKKDSDCDGPDTCVELTTTNFVDETIDCGKVGPCLELEKQVSGDGGVNFFDADECSDDDVPFTADDAKYKLIVTNCGKEAVELDRIVDGELGIDLTLNPKVTIQPDDSVTFTNDAGQTQGLLQKVGACPNPEDEFDNEATISGTGVGSGDFVEATNPACVKCGPCIEILKNVRAAENTTANYQPADTCDDSVPINEGAEYRLSVENCGPEALTGVVINDPQLDITNFPVGDLAVGETKTYFYNDRPGGDGVIPELLQPDLCEEIDPELEFENISSAEGTGVDSNITVSASNPACVECVEKCVEIVKEVSVDDGASWFDSNDCEDTPEDPLPVTFDKAEYRYTVRNCGDVDLVDVTIADPILEFGPVNVGYLAAGEQRVFTKAGEADGQGFSDPEFKKLDQPERCPDGATEDEQDFGNKLNTASVTGDPVTGGSPVTDEDPACVKCEAPICLVIIDEDGIDNGMYNIERAAPACGLDMSDNDYLVNDNDWLGMFGYDPRDPLLFPYDLLQECKENELPYDRKLPTECGNPAFLWNLFVRDGLCGPEDGPGRLALLPTGQVDDEGYFALPPKYEPTGGIRYADERPNECNKYVFGMGGVDGYDLFVRDFKRGVVPQSCLDKVRDVVPLRNQDLVELVGKTCVAIVYDSDISMNYRPQYANLQGERYGSFTFRVEMVELPALGRAIPESTSDSDFYNLWLRILPPEMPGMPFYAKKHDHEPDSIQVTSAVYNSWEDKLIVYAESNYAGDDYTAPYFPLDEHPTTFGAPLNEPLIKGRFGYNDGDQWLPPASAFLPVPDFPGDNYAFMTVSVDGLDKASDLYVDPFILEAQMEYIGGNRYKFVLENVGINLDGRDLMISTDEGGAYSVRIR